MNEDTQQNIQQPPCALAIARAAAWLCRHDMSFYSTDGRLVHALARLLDEERFAKVGKPFCTEARDGH